MKFGRPMRNTELVKEDRRTIFSRNLFSLLIIGFLIIIPVAGLSLLALIGIVSPTFNQWFAAFTLCALGIFLDWLL